MEEIGHVFSLGSMGICLVEKISNTVFLSAFPSVCETEVVFFNTRRIRSGFMWQVGFLNSHGERGLPRTESGKEHLFEWANLTIDTSNC